MSNYYKTNAGYLISVEGIDGAGKSTQINNIVAYLKDKKHEVETYREPGGTYAGESIRSIVKSQVLHQKTELLLYYAARMELMYNRVIPDLTDGKIVVLDRFVDSSMAYQGYLYGLKDEVDILNKLLPVEGDRQILPALTFYLRIDAETSIRRCNSDLERSIAQDIHDTRGYAQKSTIIKGYDICAAKDPHRIRTVDASKSIEDTWSQIKTILDTQLHMQTA